MALTEADAAREREHQLRADRRVRALLGSAEDRAARVAPGPRSEALADAFEVPQPGASRTLQDVADEYVAARWQDRLGLTRGFEHVREVASDGSWGEQVACVRQLYREVDHAIAGDRDFGADVADEVGALCRKAGATEFDMALVEVKPMATVAGVLHRHADGSPCELPRFPALPPRQDSFDEATWDAHLEKSSRAWEERQREAFGSDVAGADQAVRDGCLALRGAAFFSGGSHYSSAADREPDRVAAGGRGDASGARSASAVREPGEEPAAAPARARSQTASVGGAASQPVVENAAAGESDGAGGRRARGGGDEEGLASRLAHAADHPDRVVCEYVVECFDGAVRKAVARFDKGLDKLRGVGDPAAVARGIEEQLAAGKAEFREELEAVREQVVGEVKEALGDGYRLGSASRSVHPRTEGAGAAEDVIDAARRQFRADVDAARQESVRSLHADLGGRGDLGPPREVVPPVPSPDGDAAAREARADFVGSPRALVLGHLTRASAMVAAARGPESLAKLAESIDASPLRQGALESVGCDPVLVESVRGRPGRAVPGARRGAAPHRLRCAVSRRIFGTAILPAAGRSPRRRTGTRRAGPRDGGAALRSGPCAEPGRRGWSGRTGPPAGSRSMRASTAFRRSCPRMRISAGCRSVLGGRAWLERMRGYAVVPGGEGSGSRGDRGRPARSGAEPARPARPGFRPGPAARRNAAWAGGGRRVVEAARAGGPRAGPGRLQGRGPGVGEQSVLDGGAGPLWRRSAWRWPRRRLRARPGRWPPAARRRWLTAPARRTTAASFRSPRSSTVGSAARSFRPAISGPERARARLERWAEYRGRSGAVPELLKELHARTPPGDHAAGGAREGPGARGAAVRGPGLRPPSGAGPGARRAGVGAGLARPRGAGFRRPRLAVRREEDPSRRRSAAGQRRGRRQGDARGVGRAGPPRARWRAPRREGRRGRGAAGPRRRGEAVGAHLRGGQGPSSSAGTPA